TASPRSRGVSALNVSNLDGTSNTFMLAHKAIRPMEYGQELYPTADDSQGSGDCGWMYPSGAGTTNKVTTDFPYQIGAGNFDHFREPFEFVRDTDLLPEIKQKMGTPHPTASPVLFADGSVRSVSTAMASNRYGGQTLCYFMWYFNDGQTVNVE